MALENSHRVFCVFRGQFHWSTRLKRVATCGPWLKTTRIWSRLSSNPFRMNSLLRWLAFSLVQVFAVPVIAAAPALQLLPDNPHYFLFRGKPTVLIGSGEHYGAVLNGDFDY